MIEYLPVPWLDMREIFWIDLLQPYYNVLPGGKTTRGYRHSDATKANLSRLATGRTQSPETRALISHASSGTNNAFFGKVHTTSAVLVMTLANSAGPMFLYDAFGTLLFIFPSATTLAKLVGSTHGVLVKLASSGNMFRGGWYVSSTPLHETGTFPIIELDSTEYISLIEAIKASKHILAMVFVFDALTGDYIGSYSGVLACARALNISHNRIAAALISGAPLSNYIFAHHRVRK